MTITPADRAAAWPYHNFPYQPDGQTKARWFSGYYDSSPSGAVIRSFASHRVAESTTNTETRNGGRSLR